MEPTEDQDDLAEGLAALEAANQAAIELIEGAEGATSIVPAAGDVVAAKTEMAARRSQIVRAREEVLARQADARALIDARKAELDAQLRDMEIALAPMREQIELLEEGIWTMNLYVGRDESFTQIADGEPAPADTPPAD